MRCIIINIIDTRWLCAKLFSLATGGEKKRNLFENLEGFEVTKGQQFYFKAKCSNINESTITNC